MAGHRLPTGQAPRETLRALSDRHGGGCPLTHRSLPPAPAEEFTEPPGRAPRWAAFTEPLTDPLPTIGLGSRRPPSQSSALSASQSRSPRALLFGALEVSTALGPLCKMMGSGKNFLNKSTRESRRYMCRAALFSLSEKPVFRCTQQTVLEAHDTSSSQSQGLCRSPSYPKGTAC